MYYNEFRFVLNYLFTFLTCGEPLIYFLVALVAGLLIKVECSSKSDGLYNFIFTNLLIQVMGSAGLAVINCYALNDGQALWTNFASYMIIFIVSMFTRLSLGFLKITDEPQY